MNTIWDIVLRAVNQEKPIKKSEIFFRQEKNPSPCYEQSLPFLNQQELEAGVVEINALCRFSHIFQELLHPSFLQIPEMAGLYVYFFDVLIHWLSELDLRNGLNHREYYVRALRQDFLQGAYGKKAQSQLRLFSQQQQLLLINEVYSQLQVGASLESFRRTMELIFPGCYIYQNRQQVDEIYVYMDVEESRQEQECLAFVIDTFLPLNFKSRTFWKYHFGVLDVPETLAIDKIAIF